jgi:hypothetical protein
MGQTMEYSAAYFFFLLFLLSVFFLLFLLSVGVAGPKVIAR